MASELSINELLEEAKASLILFTELKWKGVPSANREGHVRWETQGGFSGVGKLLASSWFL